MNPNDSGKKGDIPKANPTIRQVGEDKIEIENLTFEGEADLNLEGSTKSGATGNNDLDAANDENIAGDDGSETTFDDGEDLSSDSESTGLDMPSSDSGADDLGMDDVSEEPSTPDTLDNDPSEDELSQQEQPSSEEKGKPVGSDKEGEKKDDDNSSENVDKKKNDEETGKPGPTEDGEKNPSDKNGQEQKGENDKATNPEENKNSGENQEKQGNSGKDSQNNSSNKPNDKPDDRKNIQSKKDEDRDGKRVATQGANAQKNNGNGNQGQKRNTPGDTQSNRPNKNRGNKKTGNGGSLKDRARNRAKNIANNTYRNSSLGQKVGNAKDKIDKAKSAVKNSKAAVKVAAKAGKAVAWIVKGLIAIWPVTLIVIGTVLICALLAIFTPGIKGDVKENNSNYSEVDRQTIEKLNKLFNKYPNADGSLALVTVLYPYYDSLWGTNVGSMVKGSVDPNNETEEEEDESDPDDDKSDYESEDKVQDDMYLELFQKWRYRNRLKKLLKKLNNGDEEAFFQYLKDTYFSSYGYDDMLDKTEDKETLKGYIIEDLKIKKNDFINYVGRVYNCHVTSSSAGTIEFDDIIKSGKILIDVKEENCDSDVNNCASWHSSPITLKEYVKGVTNTEISIDENTSLHKIKAQMIMVKSVVLGRYKEQNWNMYQDSDGNYIIPIRANTNDQDYCDYNVGCSNKRSGNKHGPASDGVKALLDQAYDETINEYLYNTNMNSPFASYKDNYDKYCVKGSCLITSELETGLNTGLTYDQILLGAFTSESGYSLVSNDPATGSGTAQVSGGKVCVEVGGGTGVPSDKFVYYSQTDPRWKDTQFCGRSDGTIGSSGCGVTSMAMVISTLSNKVVTPIDTMNEAYGIGYCGYGIVGTSASYFLDVAHDYELENVNLTKDSKGADKALQTLRNGGLVIANVGPKSPFTTGGHYIVIRGIASDRNVYVGDPNHEELFNTSYSIDDFIDKGWVTNGWWGFTGPKSLEFSTMIGESGVATGMFANPFDPDNTVTTYTKSGNAESFPKYKSGSCHGGVDIPINIGTAIYALDGGVVTEVGNYSSKCYQKSECRRGWNSYGIYVLIDHKNGYQTVYAHLNQRTVDVGDTVAKGQQIGFTGETGNASGPHIHFELRDVVKYSANDRDNAKCTSGLGLMNVTKYINTGISYIGGTE